MSALVDAGGQGPVRLADGLPQERVVAVALGGGLPQGRMVDVQERGRGVEVCLYDALLPERGVAALVRGRQIALFRTHDGTVYALDNRDPVSGANVLSRGIVGSRGDAPTVASPMFKQVYDLRSGQCLDDPDVRVAGYPVAVVDGFVMVTVDG